MAEGEKGRGGGGRRVSEAEGESAKGWDGEGEVPRGSEADGEG